MVRDAAAFAARRDALLQTAFDKVLPCHGEVVLSGGAKVIAEHLVL
jgi:hypothetical protein